MSTTIDARMAAARRYLVGLAKSTQVSVIVPTYCEAENLGELVPRVCAALDQAGLAGEILIVDDNSPDDTPTVCAELADPYPLRLLVRTSERGLSSAVLHGMRHAEGEVLVVMDADLSHPPEKIPELVRAVASGGADFVIGSRYVAGGRTDDEWGLLRWLNSKVATLLARPLTSARDPMAGFFALRRKTFEQARGLNPIGYKIGLELIVKADCRAVREIPITFHDRLHGQSKLTLREQLNYLRHLKRLYDHRYGWLTRPLQFCAVGASGMVVDLAVFAVLLLMIGLMPARALAIGVAMSWNFVLNRRFTFAAARAGPIGKQFVLFCLACLLGGLINWSVSVGLCQAFAFFDHWKLLAAVIGVVAGTAFNYTLSARVVFRPGQKEVTA